jgi:hypothetical protein
MLACTAKGQAGIAHRKEAGLAPTPRRGLGLPKVGTPSVVGGGMDSDVWKSELSVFVSKKY